MAYKLSVEYPHRAARALALISRLASTPRLDHQQKEHLAAAREAVAELNPSRNTNAHYQAAFREASKQIDYALGLRMERNI